MNPSREVVVTGLGVVSPLGLGHEKFWQSLLDGQSGVRVREHFEETDLPYRIAAPVENFEAKRFIKPRKAIKIMCGPIQFGCAAAAMAVEHAGLDPENTDSDRIGTVFGTETFFADPTEVADVFQKCTVDQDYQHDRWGEFAMREIQPLWMLKYLPNMAASHISIALDARGPSNSICQGEASGLLALIEAADLIRRNAADVVLTGGTGSQMTIMAVLYRGANLLSKRIMEPELASRPFDVNRDGMVVGEGAGAIVLESAEHAKARGATPLATVAGWARSFQDPSRPEFCDALMGNYESALKIAGKSANDISLVNANAAGSVQGDLVEARAIEGVFGSQVPVVAHKSNFGNIGPGTSIIETIGAVLANQHAVCPPSLNCESTDPACNINVVTSKSTIGTNGILKSSFSATGQISSIVLV